MKENIDKAKARLQVVSATMKLNFLIGGESETVRGYLKQIDNAIKELDQCSSSSAESGDVPTNSPDTPNQSSHGSTPSKTAADKVGESSTTTAAPDAASVGKLSWCKMSNVKPSTLATHAVRNLNNKIIAKYNAYYLDCWRWSTTEDRVVQPDTWEVLVEEVK